MFFTKRKGDIFVDRGDPAAFDYNVTTLTADDTWQDLDLSAFMGKREVLLLIYVIIKTPSVGKSLDVRTKGNVNECNVDTIIAFVADTTIPFSLCVYTNKDGVIQYRASNVTWNYLYLGVRGWWTK